MANTTEETDRCRPRCLVSPRQELDPHMVEELDLDPGQEPAEPHVECDPIVFVPCAGCDGIACDHCDRGLVMLEEVLHEVGASS
jgi:hypothetical protein